MTELVTVWRGDSWREIAPPPLPTVPDYSALNAPDSQRVRGRPSSAELEAALTETFLSAAVIGRKVGMQPRTAADLLWTLHRQGKALRTREYSKGVRRRATALYARVTR